MPWCHSSGDAGTVPAPYLWNASNINLFITTICKL